MTHAPHLITSARVSIRRHAGCQWTSSINQPEHAIRCVIIIVGLRSLQNSEEMFKQTGVDSAKWTNSTRARGESIRAI